MAEGHRTSTAEDGNSNDDLSEALERVTRLAIERARRMVTQHDVALAMTLEAALHRFRAATKGRDAVALAATAYLDTLRPLDRLGDPELAAASVWSGELRDYVRDALYAALRLPYPRSTTQTTKIARGLIDWAYESISVELPDVVEAKTVAAVREALEKRRTNIESPPRIPVRLAGTMRERAARGEFRFIVLPDEIDSMLRALLRALGVDRVSDITKARYRAKARANAGARKSRMRRAKSTR
jgi:hypothetical protein